MVPHLHPLRRERPCLLCLGRVTPLAEKGTIRWRLVVRPAMARRKCPGNRSENRYANRFPASKESPRTEPRLLTGHLFQQRRKTGFRQGPRLAGGSRDTLALSINVNFSTPWCISYDLIITCCRNITTAFRYVGYNIRILAQRPFHLSTLTTSQRFSAV